MKQQAIKFLFRMPEDVSAWLKHEAERNWTSQNAEIIRAIRSRMDSAQPERAVG
jgi:predicted HicB family RNase H-like nuclease